MNEFGSVVFKKKTICNIKVAQNDTIKYQKAPAYKSKKTSPKYKKLSSGVNLYTRTENIPSSYKSKTSLVHLPVSSISGTMHEVITVVKYWLFRFMKYSIIQFKFGIKYFTFIFRNYILILNIKYT